MLDGWWLTAHDQCLTAIRTERGGPGPQTAAQFLGMSRAPKYMASPKQTYGWARKGIPRVWVNQWPDNSIRSLLLTLRNPRQACLEKSGCLVYNEYAILFFIN